MGVVFLADDPQLGRHVALKTLHPAMAAVPSARARFLREAQAAAAVRHDNIVTLFQVGEDAGVPFLAMELLHGETLEERLRRAEAAGARIDIVQSVRIAAEVALGLAAAHARGVIHRDVKPANIFLEGAEGAGMRAKLLDFGLARAFDAETTLTAPGVVTGTPAYLAPELLRGEPADGRSDLFSLGCVLYRMLTGVSPFAGRDRLATLMRVASATPVPPDQLDPNVSEELASLVMRLLAKEPAERPASAQVVADALQAIERRLPGQGPRRRRRRVGRVVAASGLLALVLGAAALFYAYTDRGVIAVEFDDPDVAVRLGAGGGVIVRDLKSDREYVLTAAGLSVPSGEYELNVADATGLSFVTRRFTLKRGGKVTLTATVRPAPVEPAAPTALDAWARKVAELPAAEQVRALGDKLRELNPGFDGNVGPRFEEGKVVEVHFFTDHVTDIRPVRALPALDILVCRGSAPGRGQLEDIAPVRGLPALRYLDISANKVCYLAPLRGVTALRKLVAWANPIEDLRPLRGVPLAELDLHDTLVEDLDPLAGMPLRVLLLDAPYATDLARLAGLPLRELVCKFRPQRHAAVLRSIKSLEQINERRADAFWQDADARRADLETWLERVRPLPAEQQVEEAHAKLKQLNPGFTHGLFPKIENGAVVHLQLFTDEVTDVSPVRVFTKLRRLTIRGTEPGKGRLYNLDPLGELPLEYLECGMNAVADLGALRGMKLKVLLCAHTLVRDLTPVRELPLFYLDCQYSRVRNLAPLTGMGITRLYLKGCPLRDPAPLGPLAQMSINVLEGDFDPQRDGAVLRAIRTLETVNGRPAAEFFEQAGIERK
jgi:Leucine-rich repeat (LRR) protein